jgi:hypothetical protein
MFTAFALVAGCGDAREESPIEPGVLATVDGWSLSAERMAELLVLAQPFPLDSSAVIGFARQWVGAAALARLAAAGDDLLTEDVARAATWLERREAMLALDRQDRLGVLAVVTPPIAESTFRQGDLRLLAHVVRLVGPETPTEERALQQRTAQRILNELVEGGAWDEAVAQSEDLETRNAGGLLGLFGPGELTPALDRAARSLEPGQVSSVVETPVGFHILYRPRFEEVRQLYADLLSERRLAEFDVAATRGLLEERGFSTDSVATAALRDLAADPWRALSSERRLATWSGGALTAQTVARYVVSLPDESRRELREAGDDDLETLLETIATREIRITDAEGLGLNLDESFEELMMEQHAAEVSYWLDALSIETEPADQPERARETLARYMERVASRQVDPRALSPLFEAWLLGRVDWNVEPAAASEAIAQARAMITAADPEQPGG